MTTTPRLSLPYIIAAQAQKEVTHAASLNRLDALVQASAINNRTTPPGSPADGAVYLIDSSASGDWTGKDGQLAHYIGSAWRYYTPSLGWLVYNQAANRYLRFDGAAWVDFAGDKLNTSGGALTGVLQLASYTVASLPAAVAGGMIYVADASGGAIMAFSDGTDWRRCDDRAVVV